MDRSSTSFVDEVILDVNFPEQTEHFIEHSSKKGWTMNLWQSKNGQA